MSGYTHYSFEQNKEMLSLIDVKRGGARSAAIEALAKKWKREPLNVSQAISRLKKLRDQGKLSTAFTNGGLFKGQMPVVSAPGPVNPISMPSNFASMEIPISGYEIKDGKLIIKF